MLVIEFDLTDGVVFLSLQGCDTHKADYPRAVVPSYTAKQSSQRELLELRGLQPGPRRWLTLLGLPSFSDAIGSPRVFLVLVSFLQFIHSSVFHMGL